MPIRFLLFLCEVSPWARRFLWRWWYERLAKRVVAADWTFMNYGLAWPVAEEPLTLRPEDEPNRYCAQLYHRVVAPGRLCGKTVLEVGSGRGGGAAWVAHDHRPASLTAVDFSPKAVAFCSARHHIPNLRFQVGDAERLPFREGTFDAVLNVESSHCYGSVAAFFAEVARVLRPGGLFLLADFRVADEMPAFEAILGAVPGLTVVEREDITAMVAAALRADHERKRALIAGSIPPRQRPLFEEFAGLTGSQIQTAFEARTMRYHRFVLRRQAPE